MCIDVRGQKPAPYPEVKQDLDEAARKTREEIRRRVDLVMSGENDENE